MTTITIPLQAEQLAQLRGLADRSGLTPEEYLLHRVEELL